MLSVLEVKTGKQRREFLNFPLDLYRNNPCFVPPLYGDEKKIFSKKYVYYDTCEAVYYNAYRDGKMVGRISGVLQKSSNEKRGERRVRFIRFDCLNDEEAAKALFGAVEKWALDKGMDTVCGPLGFSDLEREGLLIEGFDELATFEEQYNADYYQTLIEKCGYSKEVDWVESKICLPDKPDDMLEQASARLMERYHLHFGPAKSIKDFLDRYADDFIKLLDKAYEPLYGTVPITPGMKKMLISNFKLIINLKYVAVILDENNKLVCLGLCFPSLAKAVQKSRGHLTPAAIVRVLRDIRNPKIIDLGLVAVDPAYANHGISAAMSAGIMRMLRDNGIEYAETNLNLEDNHNIQNQWKRFKAIQHKRRRAYVKTLGGAPTESGESV